MEYSFSIESHRSQSHSGRSFYNYKPCDPGNRTVLEKVPSPRLRASRRTRSGKRSITHKQKAIVACASETRRGGGLNRGSDRGATEAGVGTRSAVRRTPSRLGSRHTASATGFDVIVERGPGRGGLDRTTPLPTFTNDTFTTPRSALSMDRQG